MNEILQSYHTGRISLPEIIFLDFYLPDRKDGLSLLREIRQFIDANDLSGIPIIVFSYSSDEQDINAALAGQASAYLIKPTDISFFPAYLHGLCNVWGNAVRVPG